MNRVIDILMKRDGISREEATKLVDDTREEILEADPFDVDDILACNLGLEPDYIFDILG